MSRDGYPEVSLEVTVPHIVLPPLSKESAQEGEGEVNEGSEQIHLFTQRAWEGERAAADDMWTAGEVSTHTTGKSLFHLFRIKAIPALGQTLFLQILRPQSTRQGTRGGQQPLRVTEEMAFRFDYHQMPDTQTQQKPGEDDRPGQSQVVVVLDAEGIPNSYSIDGAED